MITNIFAYTAPGCNYPEFISVNKNTELEEIMFIVRGAVKEDGWCGDTVSISLNDEQRRALKDAL